MKMSRLRDAIVAAITRGATNHAATRINLSLGVLVKVGRKLHERLQLAALREREFYFSRIAELFC